MAFEAQEQLAAVPLVAQQSARMTQMYRQWPEARWQLPTCCQGWSAADVVAHLATGADFYTSVISPGRDGEPALPWGAVHLDEIRQRRAAAVRQLLAGGAATLTDGFEHAAARLQAVFESLRPQDLTRPAWHPRGLIPIGCWVGMRLIELTVHDWDMRQPHEKDASLSPLAVPAVLASLPEMQQRFLEQRLPAQGMDGVYAMHAAPRSWGFRIQGKQVKYLSAVPATVTAQLHTDAERMILLTLGRADFAAGLVEATCMLSGDIASGQCFYRTLFAPYLSSSASSQ